MKIKGVHKVKRKLANGETNTHYYAWRGGPAMEAPPHTEAFAAEHARHKQEASNAVIDTLEMLIDRFTGPEDNRNPDFLALAETTRTDHLYAFGIIKKKWPRIAVRLTQQRGMKAEIRKWHRSYSANPRKADKLLFSLSKVFSYAIADELIEKNPCTGIERLYKGSRRGRGRASSTLPRYPGTRHQRSKRCWRSTIWRTTSSRAMPSFSAWRRTHDEHFL